MPPVEERQRIVADLDAMAANMDALVARIRDAIARLQEYRAALISAAVTGQIDVRGET